MTAVPLLFKIDGKPIKLPRVRAPKGRERPAWSDYKPKTPIDCDHCVQVAYETAMAGEPHVGLRTARRKRRQDGQNLLLCHEHAQIVRSRDDIDFPPNESTSARGSGGQRLSA